MEFWKFTCGYNPLSDRLAKLLIVIFFFSTNSIKSTQKLWRTNLLSNLNITLY